MYDSKILKIARLIERLLWDEEDYPQEAKKSDIKFALSEGIIDFNDAIDLTIKYL